ncbi:MAG: hypothetical protein ACJAQ4_001179 [Cryomorphaceae bacterium]|jgi:hypothetical protein
MVNSNALSIHLKTKFTKQVFLSLLILFCANTSFAQSDTTDVVLDVERGTVEGEVQNPATESIDQLHSPKRATIMSAVLPGLGQIYNKKYWKVPIIYGGFAVAGWYLNDNNKQISLYKDAFKAETDNDPETDNVTDFTSTQLEELISQYKTWRDLSYIAIAAIYVLNIIDANVDAHLFYFDVGEDLTLNIQPFVMPSHRPVTGLTLALKL